GAGLRGGAAHLRLRRLHRRRAVVRVARRLPLGRPVGAAPRAAASGLAAAGRGGGSRQPLTTAPMPMNDSHAIVWPHLADLPAFRALIRAIEHRLLAEYQPFARPVLDVGAGDGHFASVALGPRIDVGIDLKFSDLQEARRRPVYRGVVCASATAMPLPSDCFGTVVSNCVIEHIPDLPATLAEMRRVLRPGGRLLVTVPTDRLEQNLPIPGALRGLGLEAAAKAYTDWFRQIQVHYHLLSRAEWVATFERAGFRVAHARGY